MSSVRTQLSASERLGFLVNLSLTAFDVFTALITAPFRGADGHRQFYSHVMHTATRRMNSIATANQLQNLVPSTDESYTDLAKSKNFQPVTTDFPLGAKGHWFGSPEAEKVLVWCHGGGYVYPSSTQAEIMYGLQQKIPGSAVILLSYSLAPGKQYPHQLKQIVGAVKYLLDQGRRPENIVFGGDSAGANLILAMFSHILHPHPAVESFRLNGKFKAAVFVSPWVSFDFTAPSYSDYKYKDCCDAAVLERWSTYFIGSAPADEYNQPLRASPQWWSGLDQLVSKIYVTAGAEETLFSDQEAFVNKLKVAYPKAESFYGQGETHDQPFMDPLIGIKDQCGSAKVAEGWLVELLT